MTLTFLLGEEWLKIKSWNYQYLSERLTEAEAEVKGEMAG